MATIHGDHKTCRNLYGFSKSFTDCDKQVFEVMWGWSLVSKAAITGTVKTDRRDVLLTMYGRIWWCKNAQDWYCWSWGLSMIRDWDGLMCGQLVGNGNNQHPFPSAYAGSKWALMGLCRVRHQFYNSSWLIREPHHHDHHWHTQVTTFLIMMMISSQPSKPTQQCNK